MKELTEKKKTLGKNLEKRCVLLYGELFISAIHLKVMRVYIDGVLRFGIPPTFNMLTIKSLAHANDKKIMDAMLKRFADPTQLEMYGSKEEIQDSEDFYPFVVTHINI